LITATGESISPRLTLAQDAIPGGKMNRLHLFALTLAIVLYLSACGSSRQAGETSAGETQAWVQNIEIRAFPNAFTREPGDRKIELAGLAGEFLSAQVVVKSTSAIAGLSAVPAGLQGPAGAIPAWACRVRYGALLPVDETQMLTPDPLLEEGSIDVPANLAQAVWITIRVPVETPAGVYEGRLDLKSADNRVSERFTVAVEVLPAKLPDPPDWEYYVNIWQDPSGVAGAHGVKHWSPEHWALLAKYADNFVAHGLDVITTSIVYDPWGSQTGYPYETMVEWKYPGQYQPGGAGRFEWDFSVFDRYVELMTGAGMTEKIDCFSMVEGPWINTNADIRYLDTSAGTHRLLDLTLGDPVWREVWAAFLPAFKKHLEQKGWFGRTFLAFDEKPEKEMRMIYDFLIAQAPDFKVSIAGGYPGDERKWSDEVILHFGELASEEAAARQRPLIEKMRGEGRYISFYTACTPHYPNVFLFSQLRECRLLPWIAVKYGLSGYLRWAVAAFPADVWNQPNYKWHSGDMYFVYPGRDGPLDGMRWELFRQGVEDCEAWRIARRMCETAGRSDLTGKLDRAVTMATELESCDQIPWVGQARGIVNEVIRELGGAN